MGEGGEGGREGGRSGGRMEEWEGGREQGGRDRVKNGGISVACNDDSSSSIFCSTRRLEYVDTVDRLQHEL